MSENAEKTQERHAIDAIRILSMDAVEAANSGHPGTPMALAPLALVLYGRIMTYDPADPHWPDRDRFVLSAGHASMLLYSTLHLAGFDISIDDIKQFRQLGSKTPGHPEVGHTPGVEVTTGPLGQGLANAVGMAVSERYIRNTLGEEICNHNIFVVCGDGDLSEGISHEAASFAGHQGLGKMVAIYDDNHITIDGPTELSLSDNAALRFESYGWHVINLGEVANDCDALEKAIREAVAQRDKPSLIIVRSHIGYPSPNRVDTPDAHGVPLGITEISLTKAVMDVPDQPFTIDESAYRAFQAASQRGAAQRTAWSGRLAATKEPELAQALLYGRLPTDVEFPTFETGKSLATRVASKQVLDALATQVPNLVGGGADLTGNTGVAFAGQSQMQVVEPTGRQIHFGVREHAMAAMMNGLAQHGGLIPFGGTFLVFSDYSRAAVRVAAIMGSKVIHSWSHDSVAVGEDGPTHQPIEHLATLRAMPGLTVIRPADANETSQAWKVALDIDGPVALILSRQNLPVLDGTASGQLDRGAYVLSEAPKEPQVILIGTGSEVHLCIEAQHQLGSLGVSARVVSMPSWELFESLSKREQAEILLPQVARLAVEAGTTFGWHKYCTDVIGIDTFGVSAPGRLALDHFGINAQAIVDRVLRILGEEK